MITLREIDDADPALAHSPMVRGLEKTFAWIGEHGTFCVMRSAGRHTNKFLK